ncbi:MAG: Glu-tRNA(Gln) amidotransferase subunit GatE [Candidatus Odinarchaeota archaeon]|nr:Glu-tRNA(Gln) amidotransferase subunit GatE [Candidatus Odinarchaeota archaeon]
MAKSLDYEKLGLRVGLEIHQQLDTKSKLFCNCPTVLREDEPDITFVRRLRPTQSELGEIDPAARFEFEKKKLFVYQSYNDTVCLVEHDEEPPHLLDKESLEIALTVALLMNATPVDEVHVMRKIVIDGSNTSGFQRTSIIALGGYITLPDSGKKIGIQTLCLEEDAARKISEDEKTITYRLDRLGIPLIEIATAPDIHTPEEARAVALRIGQLLRSTKRVKRGLGTIRQDINISIKDGAIIEVKGIQKLDLIDKIVENEVKRQVRLLELRDELKKRGLNESMFKSDFVDVTDALKDCKSSIIKNTIKRGGVILALKLPKFNGLLGFELQPNYRFGTELAEHVKFWSGLKGLFHTDELPKYGITETDVLKIRELTNASDEDAVVIVAGPKDKCTIALEKVLERAKQALYGVPEETRGGSPDGITHYLRPRPGAARMYPETDVPPTPVADEMLDNIRKNIPELPEEKYKRFREAYKLNEKLANAMIRSLYIDIFEDLVNKYPSVSPTTIATTFENTLISLRRESIPIENLDDNHFDELFGSLASGKISKEAIPEVLAYLAKNPEKHADDAIKELKLESITPEELDKIIDAIIAKNKSLIEQRKEKAYGPLMGMVMKQVRGRIDGKIVGERLKEKIKQLIQS